MKFRQIQIQMKCQKAAQFRHSHLHSKMCRWMNQPVMTIVERLALIVMLLMHQMN